MTKPTATAGYLQDMRTTLGLLLALACGAPATSSGADPAPPTPTKTEGTAAAKPPPEGMAVAIFAGGCFWCMEKPFDHVEGVSETLSGYTGGSELHPTYNAVSAHKTSHKEAIHVLYDPNKVTYARLLEVFWHNIDPFQDGGQFCDKGEQYESAIFPLDDAQRAAAEASKAKVQAQFPDKAIATTIEPASTFWVAEEYHQDFYEKNPVRYTSYRQGCGRDARLAAIWGDAAGH